MKKYKLFLLIIVVLFVVTAVSQYRLYRSVKEGIEWNYSAVKASSQAYLDEYKESLPVKEKYELLQRYCYDNYEHIKAIEVMSEKSIFFRKYYIDGFSDLVLTLANNDNANEVNEKAEELKEKCLMIVDM